MDFLCKKVFILFLICKITDFASHKRETYYFFYFISADDRARLETATGRWGDDKWLSSRMMSLFSELSVLEVCPERESRSKYFCFRISISPEISFNSADAAKAKQARPILLKCQSFFFARRKTTKRSKIFWDIF